MNIERHHHDVDTFPEQTLTVVIKSYWTTPEDTMWPFKKLEITDMNIVRELISTMKDHSAIAVVTDECNLAIQANKPVVVFGVECDPHEVLGLLPMLP
jgi:hypothetical protein